MLNHIIKSFFVVFAVSLPAFADGTLSAFHQRDSSYDQEPMSEDSYFATLAPLPSRTSGYFGLNIGAGLNPLKSSIEVDDRSGAESRNQKKDTLGANVGIYTGYGTNFNRFYLSGEFNIGYNFLSKTITDVVNGKKVEFKVHQPLIASFDIIPGILSSDRDKMLYARVGLATSLYRLSFTDVTTTAARDNNSNKVSLGLNSGLGIQFFTSDSFSIRIEYLYSRYNRVISSYESVNLYSYRLKTIGYHRINLGFSIHY